MTKTRLPLFVDWLAVSAQSSTFCESEELTPMEGCSMVYQTPTNIWNHRAIMVNAFGDKVLTVLWKPKSTLIPSNAGLVEVANEWFYHGASPTVTLKSFCDLNSATITGVSRVDLACDFEASSRELAIIFGLAEGRLYVVGKRNGSLFWSTSQDNRLPEHLRGRPIPHCQSWGHKTSQVKWKLYYKWKELCETAGPTGYDKCYIVDAWRAVGLKPSLVWRLEVSLHHLNGLALSGREVSLNTLLFQGVEIFCALYNDRFAVRKKQGHKDKTNDERVDFLPVAKMQAHVRHRECVAEYPRHAMTPLLRNLIRSLDELPILMDDEIREGILWQIDQIVTSQHLVAYASAIVDKNIYEWFEEKRVEAYNLKV